MTMAGAMEMRRGGAQASTQAPRSAQSQVAVVLLAAATFALSSLALATPALASRGVTGFLGSQSGEPALGGTFDNPQGVAVNQTTGDIYVADHDNARVERFDASGAFIAAWGRDVIQSGKPGDLGEGMLEVCTVPADCKAGKLGSGVGGELGRPEGIAVDQATGNVYVSEQFNRRVSEFTANGEFVRTFGWDVETGGGSTFEVCTVAANCKRGEGGSNAGQFGGIGALGGVAIGPGGTVYVADPNNNRVQKFNAEGAFLSAFGWDVVPEGKAGDTGFGLESCPSSAASTAGDCQEGTPGAGLGQFSTGQPTGLAVDSGGAIYAVEPEENGNERTQRFNSAATSASIFATASLSGFPGPTAVAVDPTTNHVFVSKPCSPATCSGAAVSNEVRLKEFESSGTLLDTHLVGEGLETINGLAVNSSSGMLYASSPDQRVYEISTPPAPDATMGTVDNITGTSAEFHGEVNPTGLNTGYHFEYRPDGSSTWTKAPEADASAGNGNIAAPVAQSVSNLIGSTLYHVRLVATKRYLLGGTVAATTTSAETTFTTLPSTPRIQGEAATQITDSTATLTASINPAHESTAYRFEYGSADCSANPCTSIPIPDANIDAGGSDVVVARELTALLPGTEYHFRVVATNPTGPSVGEDSTFTTYPTALKGLPDGRAYELVTPPATNGLFPLSFIGAGGGRNNFSTPLASPSGESVVFDTEGALPGTAGNGSVDAYEAVRGSAGWRNHVISPSGGQTEQPGPGGLSPDHAYAFWESGNSGSLAVGGVDTSYMRLPGASFQLFGEGSMGTDPAADAKLITPGASHIVFATGVFASAVQLEPDAPEAPFGAVYDRTPGGTHVVSLLPGDLTPTATARYQGASANASAVVFQVEETLYVRLDDTTTVEVASGNPMFAGISQNGETIFYFRPDGSENPTRGDIYAFDPSTKVTTPIVTGGGSTVVNISTDGSHVYFVSTQQLNGVEGTPGANNLYVWNGTTTRFIATLDPTDLTAFDPNGLVNLAVWTTYASGNFLDENHGPADDPSRTTPDGNTFVFQSHASLKSSTGGHSEVYLYNADTERLACISCNPTGALITSDAELQGLRGGAPTNALSQIPNVTSNGRMVFFQSREALVPGDSDGSTDVYEWKEGALSLISSGHSNGTPDFLYGMTPDGHDIFFETRDALLPEDQSGGAGAIYDARIAGGFPAVQGEVPCVAEDNCQGVPSSPPALPAPGSESIQSPLTGVQPHRCRKGSHRVKRHGRSRCVKNRRGRPSSRRHGSAR
jgi:dipeptidyl aminopeptidase/acylaminoacyl peptidase